ncbi:MAG TPA: hypothetical protein VHE13_16105 [Opitutus sp.]|nr:hypothetical protein [Opitutus sp.]
MSSVAAPREAPWRAGLQSARANLLPGLALQVTALALVLAYYYHAPTRGLLSAFAAWRREVGLVSSIVSTGFFGGVIPVLVLRLRPATRARYSGRQGIAIIAFWAYKGFEVDLFYRLLAHFVGAGHDFATVATKTVIDQFFYSPLFAVPATALFFEWVAIRFEWLALRDDVRAGSWYRRRILPVIVSNLGIWLPAVCIIYSLPTPLQLPLQNLVLCFFTLIIAHLTRRTV